MHHDPATLPFGAGLGYTGALQLPFQAPVKASQAKLNSQWLAVPKGRD